MAHLTESERLFIAQRRARKHIGLFVIPGVLLLLIAIWVAMFFWWPMAVNPKAIWGAQETGLLECGTGTLSGYATTAAVLVNVAFLLVSAMLIAQIGWARSERRYLKLLEKATLESATGLAHEQLGAGSLRQ